MKLASITEFETIHNELLEGLPRHILLHLSSHGSCRQPQILSEASRYYPFNFENSSLNNWVNSILEWFALRGDIIRGPRNLYHCLPPYMVRSSSLTSNPILPLFGDPQADEIIENELHSSISLKSEIVFEEHYWDQDKTNPMLRPIGIERSLHFGDDPITSLENFLNKSGITILDSSTLRQSIPKVSELSWPPTQDFDLPQTVLGRWEVYDANQKAVYQAARWHLEPDWQTASYRLIRFNLGVDTMPVRRHYFNHEEGRLFEIGRDEALWWQFRLDLDVKNTTTWYLVRLENELWINGPLPAAVSNWLRFISVRPPVKKMYWTCYEIMADQINEVKSLAFDNLGVIVKDIADIPNI